MAKTKKIRAISFIIALAMIACLAPTVAFAENTVTMKDISFDSATSQITAAGSIASGAELTMMAVRTDAEITNADDFFAQSDSVIETAIMYIDQITSDGTEKAWTFGLRDSGATGKYITVFMGGTDAAMQSKSYTMVEAAGSAALSTPGNERDYFVYGYDELKLTYTDSATPGWEAAVETSVVDANGDAAGSVGEDGTITLDTAPATKTAYTIKFAAEGYTAVANKTFTAISAIAAAKAALPASLEIDKTTDPANWSITVPGNTSEYGVTITYTAKIGGAEAVDKTAGETFDVAVPAGDAETAVVVTAKLNDTEDTKAYNITVSSKAPAIGEDDISYANFDGEVFENVYGTDGAVIAEITTEEVDAATQKLKVRDTEFLYSPSRGVFIGIVAGFDTKADLAGAIEIVEGASAKVYYGNVDDPLHEYWQEGDGIALADVMKALNMYKNPAAANSAEQYISADVDQDGEVLLSDVMQILQGYKGTRTSFDVEG